MFPLKKSMEEVVLFDRKQGWRDGLKVEIHLVVDIVGRGLHWS